MKVPVQWNLRSTIMSEQLLSAEMRIGELAGQLGLNPKTVRYYEDIGLLPRPRRTPAGYRLYAAADRDRPQFIVKARAIGLTLEEIGHILALRGEGQPPCVHVLGLLDQKVAAVDQHLRALTAFRQELAALRDEAAKSVDRDAPVCAIIEHHELATKHESPCNAITPIGTIRRKGQARTPRGS